MSKLEGLFKRQPEPLQQPPAPPLTPQQLQQLQQQQPQPALQPQLLQGAGPPPPAAPQLQQPVPYPPAAPYQAAAQAQAPLLGEEAMKAGAASPSEPSAPADSSFMAQSGALAEASLGWCGNCWVGCMGGSLVCCASSYLGVLHCCGCCCPIPGGPGGKDNQVWPAPPPLSMPPMQSPLVQQGMQMPEAGVKVAALPAQPPPLPGVMEGRVAQLAAFLETIKAGPIAAPIHGGQEGLPSYLPPGLSLPTAPVSQPTSGPQPEAVVKQQPAPMAPLQSIPPPQPVPSSLQPSVTPAAAPTITASILVSPVVVTPAPAQPQLPSNTPPPFSLSLAPPASVGSGPVISASQPLPAPTGLLPDQPVLPGKPALPGFRRAAKPPSTLPAP